MQQRPRGGIRKIRNQEDTTVKKLLLAAAAIVALAVATPAGAIEILNKSGAVAAPGQRVLPAMPPRAAMPSTQLSELPEPEVLAMMLLGLVLIGYRASRDASEKFK